MILVVSALLAVLGCATQQSEGLVDSAPGVVQSTAESDVARVLRIRDLTAEQIDWTASGAWARYGMNEISLRLLYAGLREYHHHPALLRAMADLFVEDYPVAAAPVFYYLKHTNLVLTTDQQEKIDLMYASAMSLWGLSRKKDGTPTTLGDFFEPEMFDWDVEGLRSAVQPTIDAAGSIEAVLDGLHAMLGLATGFVAGDWDGTLFDLFDLDKYTLRAEYHEWIELPARDEIGELLILEATAQAPGEEQEIEPGVQSVADPRSEADGAEAKPALVAYVPIVANWRVGESRTYQTTTRRVTRKEDGTEDAQKSSGEITVAVVSAQPGTMVLEWRTSVDMPLEGLAPLVDAEFSNLLNEFLTIAYTTTDTGEFLQVNDVDELGDAMQEFMESIIEAIPVTAQERTVARTLLGQLLSPANYAALFGERMMVFHSLHGYEYAAGQEIEYEEAVPSPLTGDLIPTTATFLVEAIEADGVVRVRENRNFDPEVVREVIVRTLGGTLESLWEADGELPDYKSAPMAMSSSIHWDIDLETGWPVLIQTVEAIEVAGSGRIDTVRMELIDEPQ